MAVSVLKAVALGFCLLVVAGLVVSQPDVLKGRNDFLVFRTASRVPGPELYNWERYYRQQQQEVGYKAPALLWTRPAWYAAVLNPLGWLPYTKAYVLWRAAYLACLAAAVFLARMPGSWYWILVSVPLWVGFLQGQDVAMLVLPLVAATRVKDPFWSGVILALPMGIKPHLFILTPLLIVRKRLWRLAAGVLASALVLVGLSFLICGPGWPRDYVRLLMSTPIHPMQEYMPNLIGVLSNYPGLRVVAFALIPLILYAVWAAAARYDHLLAALGPVVIGSMLLSRHAYFPDCGLLLFPLMAMTRESGARLGDLLLWPVVYLPYWILFSPQYLLLPAALLIVLAGRLFAWRALPASAGIDSGPAALSK